MADELDKLFIASLQDLKSDFKSLDSKFDQMHEVLIKNSVVLVEHERRSTASEARLTIVENKIDKNQTGKERIKGFLIITGSLITTAAAVAGIIELLLLKK